MKRHIIKDVTVALLPLTLFFSYALLGRRLSFASRATYNLLPISLFNLIVPMLIGAILCVVLNTMILAGGFDGVDLAGVINGAYIAMFWVSLASLIRARRGKTVS